ncbi:MAG: Ig-like domain-containing protein [Saprospiraceae bacterium]|nr:Ig-like domain-containing protein [Saprospiraceae bacterium]
MKTGHTAYLFAILLGWVSLLSCGTGGVLTGGAKDETPPKIDSLRSTPFYRTDFYPKELEFYFDEFIELRDPIKQILISPPTKYIPQVKHRGKKLTFRFDDKEVLRENATYIINFGESVVDFREGNKLLNFNYVFSTGPVIDSLGLQGMVMDAISGKPEEGIIVGLYVNGYDSIPAKEKPFYFVKTDKEGKFTFSNIRSDSFLIFVLRDENANYQYDNPAEKMAFLDEPLYIRPDTIMSVELRASIADYPPKLRSSLSRDYGRVSLIYSGISDTITAHTEPPMDIFREFSGDSLHLFYHTDLDSFLIITSADSIKIRPKAKADWIGKTKLTAFAGNISKLMSIKDSLIISFNYPVARFDSTLIYVQDSIGIPDNLRFSLSESRRQMIIQADWRFNNLYDIDLDSGSVTDIYGHTLDSVSFRAGFLNRDQLAGINLTLSGLDTALQYVLILKRNNAVLQRFLISDQSVFNYKAEWMHPDKYTLEIIEDRNGNGRWDPGNYWKKRQPERIQIFETERIRANWDNDIEISWKYALKTTEPDLPDNR